MEKQYNAIALCSAYGVGKTTVTQQIFSYFEPLTFMSSKSVALRQSPKEENISGIVSEILKAKDDKKVLLINPYTSDLLEIIKIPEINIFNIFLNASKTTIETHLVRNGFPKEDINADLNDAVQQISFFENNRKVFHFSIEIDALTPKDIAKKIASQLILRNVIPVEKSKMPQ